jgi:hypothetical protein
MATSTPTPSGDPPRTRDNKAPRPPSLDPRSQSAIDNLGVDDQADLLGAELDEEPGDRDASGHSFADDVRSDSSNADEDNERR